MQPKCLFLACAVAMVLSCGVQAQVGVSDQKAAQSIVALLPAPTPRPGAIRRDESALKEIRTYEELTLSFPSSVTTFEGTLTVGDATSAKSFGATMIIGEGKRFRLDIHSPVEQSLRVFGAKAERTTSQGGKKAVPATLFGTPFLFPESLKAIISNPALSIVDEGTITVGNKRLRRICLSEPSGPVRRSSQSADLYFDPETNLLTYSLVMAPVEEQVAYVVRRVVQYEKYSVEGASYMPHQFVEFDNGEPDLTFSAERVFFEPAADDSQFHF